MNESKYKITSIVCFIINIAASFLPLYHISLWGTSVSISGFSIMSEGSDIINIGYYFGLGDNSTKFILTCILIFYLFPVLGLIFSLILNPARGAFYQFVFLFSFLGLAALSLLNFYLFDRFLVLGSVGNTVIYLLDIAAYIICLLVSFVGSLTHRVSIIKLIFGKSKSKPADSRPVNTQPVNSPMPKPAETKANAFTFCPECGTKNSAESNFCENCGTKLEKDS